MRKSLWIMVALLFVAIGPPDARANDSVVTLDVSGIMSPVFGTCAPSPCTLGGDIVINSTTGTITSVDISLAGASPSLAMFDTTFGFGPFGSTIQVFTSSPPENSNSDELLLFLSGNPGTLIG